MAEESTPEILLRRAGHQGCPKIGFVDFSGHVSRERCDHLDLLGPPNGPKALSLEIGAHQLDGQCLSAGLEFDHGTDPFAGSYVRQTQYCDIHNLRMPSEEIFYLGSRDVLSVADDDVFEPPRDSHKPVGIDRSDISGSDISVSIEDFAVKRSIDVPQHLLRSLNSKLSRLTWGGPRGHRLQPRESLPPVVAFLRYRTASRRDLQASPC